MITNRDRVERFLTKKWLSSREIANDLDLPLSSVTSILSTLYEFDSSIEWKMEICPFHNRPVKHWRRKH